MRPRAKNSEYNLEQNDIVSFYFLNKKISVILAIYLNESKKYAKLNFENIQFLYLPRKIFSI